MAKKEKQVRYVALSIERHNFTGDKYANFSVSFVDARTESGDAGYVPYWSAAEEQLQRVAITAFSSNAGNYAANATGWRIGLSEGSAYHPLSVYKADMALKTAKKLEANVERCSVKFGAPKTFGMYVAYALDGMNVDSIMVERQQDRYSLGRYAMRQNIADAIDGEAARVWQELNPTAANASLAG